MNLCYFVIQTNNKFGTIMIEGQVGMKLAS